MKDKVLILTSFLFLGISSIFAQEVSVDCTISLKGSLKPDTIYIGIYPTYLNLPKPLPKPEYFYSIADTNFTFTVAPGIYTIAFFAFGHNECRKISYIPPNVSAVNIDVSMEADLIGYGNKVDMSVIKEVEFHIVGRRTRNNKKVLLEKQGDICKLTETPPTLKKGDRYRFRVNGQLTEDLLNPIVAPNKYWTIVNGIYTGNDIIFNPALYNHSSRKSKIVLGGIESDGTFKQFLDEINKYEPESDEKIKNAYRSSKDELHLVIDTILRGYAEMEKKYNPIYSQIVIEKQLELLTIKLMTLNFPKGDKSDEIFIEEQKTFFLSDEFEAYFLEVNNRINKLDPNSYLLKGDFVSSILTMQHFLDECPELVDKFDLTEKYYEEFLNDFIQKSPNEKLVCHILFNQAQMNSYDNEDKTIVLLENLQNNYSYEKYFEKEKIERLLAKINIKLGKKAPDFSTKSLTGKLIKLEDYSGKFVFIDFWGSWCAPCRKEIPNLKKLYSSVTRDKLEIIGLAQDKEPELRKYIADNEIKYPNALAPKELLAKFGISRFPTSFLINPEGMIVRMNMRGEDTMILIKYEIDNYFK
jgi:peroxiredoxin